MRKLNRIMPKNPVQAMETFSIQSPLETHFRRATCDEANCANRLNGWRIHVERIVKMADGELLLRDIKASGKKFTTLHIAEGQTYWVFEAGQECFDGDAGRHKVKIGRPDLFVVRGGDWRGNPRGDHRVHTSMEDWIDNMSENRDKLMTRLAQG